MNRKFRFSAAVIMAVVLVLIAANTWAAPKFTGTVPEPPEEGQNTDTGGTSDCASRNIIDMGTALFSDAACTLEVVKVSDPSKDYPAAPAGLVFVGDTFKVTSTEDGTSIKVCYAYPPALADKAAKLYKLNDTVTPAVWEEVPDAVVVDGQLCATSTAGVFTLFGNK